jgi:hypothetical protein
VVAGAADTDNYTASGSRRTLQQLNAKTWRAFQNDSDGQFLVCRRVMQKRAGRWTTGSGSETGTGVEQDDRAGKTVAERIRAATAGLLAKAGRVGERLRGMAEDVGLMQRENAR